MNLTGLHIALAVLVSASLHSAVGYFIHIGGSSHQSATQIDFVLASAIEDRAVSEQHELPKGQALVRQPQRLPEQSEKFSRMQPAREAWVRAPTRESHTAMNFEQGLRKGKEEDSRVQKALEESQRVRATYQQLLVTRLDQVKRYPRRAYRQRLEGKVLLDITLQRNGMPTQFAIKEHARHSLFDAEVLAMVERAKPFPHVPEVVLGEFFRFLVPVAFELNH